MQFHPSLKAFTKVYVSLAVFAFILLSGMIGYMVIENYRAIDAIYMTVITVATVGFSEVKPLSDAGRMFTVFLILANIGTFTYFITQISSYFLDGEFSRQYKLYTMQKKIAELENHVIICGFGRNGREAAKILFNNKRQFVIIEKAEHGRDEPTLPVEFYLRGDATTDDILMEAGITKASAVITTLPEDADNLLVVLTARELNPKLKIISRASNDSTVRKLKTAGADNVIMPDKIGGAHMASLILSPDVKEFVDLMTTQNSEHFSIAEFESNKTLTLSELNCWATTGATLLGIKGTTGEYTLNPVPQTVLKPGHRVIAMGAKEQLFKLKQRLS
jgi:voltage-gated potassium channel